MVVDDLQCMMSALSSLLNQVVKKNDLLSSLLLRMDKEVTNKVQASNGYEEVAFAAFDVFAI